MLNLSELQPTRLATIKDFNNSSSCIKRLLSLGIEPGATVRMEYKAPGGKTFCISSKNRMIALDFEEAKHISIIYQPK